MNQKNQSEKSQSQNTSNSKICWTSCDTCFQRISPYYFVVIQIVAILGMIGALVYLTYQSYIYKTKAILSEDFYINWSKNPLIEIAVASSTENCTDGYVNLFSGYDGILQNIHYGPNDKASIFKVCGKYQNETNLYTKDDIFIDQCKQQSCGHYQDGLTFCLPVGSKCPITQIGLEIAGQTNGLPSEREKYRVNESVYVWVLRNTTTYMPIVETVFWEGNYCAPDQSINNTALCKHDERYIKFVNQTIHDVELANYMTASMDLGVYFRRYISWNCRKNQANIKDTKKIKDPVIQMQFAFLTAIFGCLLFLILFILISLIGFWKKFKCPCYTQGQRFFYPNITMLCSIFVHIALIFLAFTLYIYVKYSYYDLQDLESCTDDQYLKKDVIEQQLSAMKSDLKNPDEYLLITVSASFIVNIFLVFSLNNYRTQFEERYFTTKIHPSLVEPEPERTGIFQSNIPGIADQKSSDILHYQPQNDQSQDGIIISHEIKNRQDLLVVSEVKSQWEDK